MQQFEMQKSLLFQSLGESKKMVLSTSLHDKVTSRTMSIIILDAKFYFQSDIMFRKYEQILGNPNVSLCVDNIQIEGRCFEIGPPASLPVFCELFEKNFSASYKRYTSLKNERVFEVNPLYIQKWIYENNEPFIEQYDFCNMIYRKKPYMTESAAHEHLL